MSGKGPQDPPSEEAAFERHLAIGKASLSRGFIDLNELARVMFELGHADAPRSDEVWLAPGRLDAEQLQQVLLELSSPTIVTAWRDSMTSPGGAVTELAHINADERYKMMGLLGRGGMGSVFECLDAQLGRSVALKAIRSDYTGSHDSAVKMLAREARLTGGLEHPNIIPIYDAGRHAQFGAHFVMRLVNQPSLQEVLHDLRLGNRKTEEEYRLGRLLRYFIQVCNAVDYGHSRGVIHCDLKPANILLGAFGEVLVVDWGLAYSCDENVVYRGGTLGYMAPEQLDPKRKAYDARTDVFALGCILYEVLTLEMAFPDVTIGSIIDGDWLSPPVRPRELVPERRVPEDLEEIAMKALALAPADRYATAREVADAIETVIEGTKERERRRARADELAREGDSLAASYFEQAAGRPAVVAEIDALRNATPGWESPEKKRVLWEAEDRLAVNDNVGTRLVQAALSGYEQALAQFPDHAEARRGLTRLYHAELQRAALRHDEFNRLYFEELVRLYDDGTYVALEEQDAQLTLHCRPSPAFVEIARIEERDRRLMTAAAHGLGDAPIDAQKLRPGQYSLSIKGSTFSEVRYPFEVSPGQRLTLDLDLSGAADLAPGEIFIPGGPAFLGGSQTMATRSDLAEVFVPAFVIAEKPVTTAEYLAFLEALHAESPARVLRFLPSRSDGIPYWQRGADGFVPLGASAWGGYDELVALPIFGIDAQSAEAYTAWKARETGRPYRLPNDLEWEKAARGTDGRRYPWGDAFDASFCKMRESRPFAPRPEPSGTFVHDVSPYGVRDMAGGVADWVIPAGEIHRDPGGDRLLVTRGGAWCDWQMDCLVGARRTAWASEWTARVGLRLARSVD